MNMKQELLKYIKSPISRENLVFSKEQNKLFDKKSNRYFEIKEGVPVLFSEKAEDIHTEAEQHKAENTQFNYVEHYLKDAEESDYNRKLSGGVAHHRKRLAQTILSAVSSTAKDVLDVGCGRAWVAGYFSNSDVNVISFDIAIVNTVKALKTYPFETHYAVVGDGLNPPFKYGMFDTIIASEIMEHVPEPDKFLDSLMMLLKPGGRLIITTPYKEKLKYSLCIHCNKKTPHSAHIHSFDEKKIISLYTKDDLNKTEIRIFMSKLTELVRLYKFLKFLSFKVWRLADRFMNFLFNKPHKIMVVFYKK